MMHLNADDDVVAGFGDEWSRFDQSALSDLELETMFEAYFHIFPWSDLPEDAEGFDLGCGSGRWARLVAARVGKLHCIDASQEALNVAGKNLAEASNCTFHHASVDSIPLPDNAMDFGYSLGVLHHIPDTLSGLKSCTDKLKIGAPFLLYLYYALDGKPPLFKMLWKFSDMFRRAISKLPPTLRFLVSQVIAVIVYWPLARSAAIAEAAGVSIDNFPLSSYRHRSFYVMRTDALDRFGTRIEHRYTRETIEALMVAAGLHDLRFSEQPPYWCAVGIRK
jgi:SAM-dependent methyltransferase